MATATKLRWGIISTANIAKKLVAAIKASETGELRAVGRLLHRSTTMAFCEGSVFGAGDKLCAHATGTFKYLRALPAGRQLKPLGGEGD